MSGLRRHDISETFYWSTPVKPCYQAMQTPDFYHLWRLLLTLTEIKKIVFRFHFESQLWEILILSTGKLVFLTVLNLNSGDHIITYHGKRGLNDSLFTPTSYHLNLNDISNFFFIFETYEVEQWFPLACHLLDITTCIDIIRNVLAHINIKLKKPG